MGHLLRVPHDLFVHVAEFLIFRELASLSEVSREMLLRADSEKVWMPLSLALKIYHPWDHHASPRIAFKQAMLYQRRFLDAKKLSGESSIKAHVRFRPTTPKDDPADALQCVYQYDAHHAAETQLFGPPLLYSFDQVYDTQASNKDVFDGSAHNALVSIFHGVDSTMFVYGQSNSGKTHTVLGPPTCILLEQDLSNGLLPQMCHKILGIAQQEVNQGNLHSFELSLSCVEACATSARSLSDMLSVNRESVELVADAEGIAELAQIRRKSKTMSKALPASTAHLIHGADDVVQLLRMVRSHRPNARGHMVYCLKLVQTNPAAPPPPPAPRAPQGRYPFPAPPPPPPIPQQLQPAQQPTNARDAGARVIVSRVYFVDLAGHEQSDQQSINLSLATLRRCLVAVAQRDAHIPFRESALTELLQQSMSGQARITLMIAASSTRQDQKVTISSFRFAHQVSLSQHVLPAPQACTDGITQEILRIDKYVSELMKSRGQKNREKLRVRLRSGDLGRGEVNIAALDNDAELHRQQARRAELIVMHRAYLGI